MRIALMPSTYHPQIGGVEELSRNLASQLRQGGHIVEVWTSDGPDHQLPKFETLEGVSVRRFHFLLPRAYWGAVLDFGLRGSGQLFKLLLAAHRFRPDIVHVQCFSGQGLYATIVCRALRIPMVVTLQGETVMDANDIYDHSLTLRSALRLGLRSASQVTACSQFVLDDARRFGLVGGSVVPNAARLAPTSDQELSVSIPFERFVLGMGRLVHKKGFDLLLRAFAGLEDSAGTGLVIAGDGGERAALEALAAKLGIEGRVHFTGPLDRAGVSSVLTRAAVFCMPSRVEPFGIVAIEAWAAGVPVVATSVGGASDFVTDGISGLLVDPKDTVTLSQALTRALHDSSFRGQVITAGAKAAKAYTWPRITPQYVKIYQALLPQQPGHAASQLSPVHASRDGA